MEDDKKQFTIEIRKNGSLLVKGLEKLVNSKGEEIEIKDQISLCRCGHSANKPFCDGSHRRVNFVDEDN